MVPVNEHAIDRTLRVLLGVTLMWVGFTGVVAGVLGTVVGVVGFVPLLTGVLGWCPLYSLLGINTCPAERR